MFFPILEGESKKKSQINTFLGLNRTEMARVGELSDMENITSDKFPSLCPSVKKENFSVNSEIKNIQAIGFQGEGGISGFTGVADGKFYYKNEEIPFMYDSMEIPKDKNVELLDFGEEIIIMPAFYSYSYKNPEKSGKVYPMNTGVYAGWLYVYSRGDLDMPVEISFTDGSAQSWIEYGFKVGDSVVVECDEYKYDYLNVYVKENEYEQVGDYKRMVKAIVTAISDRTLTVTMYNDDGKVYGVSDYSGNAINNIGFNGSLRVYKRLPKLSHGCIYQNRLWVTTEDGKYIYASKPGNPKELTDFSGLSTDSWYTLVGEKGKFTGLVAFRDGVVAFKESRIYHIFGDRPKNFNIAKTFSNCGSIDENSIAVTDTSMYFVASDGVYEYSGGNPIKISRNLGAVRYKSANAFSDGRKYYFSPNNENKLYAYDRESGLWHIEGLFKIMGGIKIDGFVYFITPDKVLKMTDIYENEWSATLSALTENDMRQKGISNIFLRVENGENSTVSVAVSHNGGEFKECGFTNEVGEYTFRIPVRFKKDDKYNIKISGKGSSVIKAIERSFYIGGGAFTRKG